MQATPAGTTTVELFSWAFSWAQLGAAFVVLLLVGLIAAAVILLLIARRKRQE
jgi:hypothetical protein